MEQSPSWEANMFSASQEVRRSLWNRKAHCRIHKYPPPVPILNQINPVHASSSHFLKIYFNMTIPAMPMSSKWSLSLGSSHQSPACTSSLPRTCHMPRPSHSSTFGYPKDIWWGVEIIRFPFMQCSALHCRLVPLRSKYLPQHTILAHPQPTFLHQCEWPSLTLIKNNRQNCSSVYLDPCSKIPLLKEISFSHFLYTRGAVYEVWQIMALKERLVTFTVDHQNKYYHLRQNLPPLPVKPRYVTLTQCRVMFSIKSFF